MAPHPEPFFLDLAPGPLGRRYALYHAPAAGLATGMVVHVHPFAEEMNKARRMTALQSRALAQAGFAVLQIDLLGCGDSAGDFGDATWAQWVVDVVHACEWLQTRQRDELPGGRATPPLWLWGVRAGCLIAAEAAARLRSSCNFLFWQPSVSGAPLLSQFLRMRVAGDLIGGAAKGVMAQLRHELSGGHGVEVAGYLLSPAMSSGLERAALRPPAGAATSSVRVEWFEVSPLEGATLSPAATQAATHWREAGFSIRTHLVRGPAFWQTTEIEDAPELLTATLAALTSKP